jgi:FkbM family methyltransferase
MAGWRHTGRLFKRAVRILMGRDLWQRVQIRCEELPLGNAGASWSVFLAGLSRESVAYSFGVGEDISFDLELIRRFGLKVHAFDPTPRSMEWIGKQDLPKEFTFHPYGVADHDGICKFLPPLNRKHVSHTMLARETPWPAIELPVQRLTTIMARLGHERIDLLKMDIEGSEYTVLADLLASGVRVDQLLVEFHHRWPEVGAKKTKEAIRELNNAGYRIFSISPTGEEYSFWRLHGL